MAELKTKQTAASVSAFIAAQKDPALRKDCKALVKLMSAVTKAKPKLWGSSIVGFGSYHYRYASGREGEWMLLGFSPRKQALTLYVMGGFEDEQALLQNLGTFKTGKACLYVKRLADLEPKALEKLLRRSVKAVKARAAG